MLTSPLLVGLVLERATGTPVADYTSQGLWQPPGAEADASWSSDSEASGFGAARTARSGG